MSSGDIYKDNSVYLYFWQMSCNVLFIMKGEFTRQKKKPDSLQSLLCCQQLHAYGLALCFDNVWGEYWMSTNQCIQKLQERIFTNNRLPIFFLWAAGMSYSIAMFGYEWGFTFFNWKGTTGERSLLYSQWEQKVLANLIRMLKYQVKV